GHSQRPGGFMLAGPASHVPVAPFPVEIRLSVYAHVTGGRGSYPLGFVLRDPGGEGVWHWRPAAPRGPPDPPGPQQLAFHDPLVAGPAGGRDGPARRRRGARGGPATPPRP